MGPSSSALPASSSSVVAPSSSSSSPHSSSSSSRAPSGIYVVSPIDLDAIEGHHKGTGARSVDKLLLDPASVNDPKLTFSSDSVKVTTKLYELNDDSVAPNWFGVAYADGVTDFTKPIIYFHPTPNQGPYQTKDYKTKTGTDGFRSWRELFEYVDRLGQQLAGAMKRGATMKDSILIFPFMTTEIAGSAGILPQHWKPIVTDILRDVRASVTGAEGPLTVSDLVVASFSNGTSYSQSFRSLGVGVTAVLSQVWDFDGVPPVTSQKPTIRYSAAAGNNFNQLADARWGNIPDPPPSEEPPLFVFRTDQNGNPLVDGNGNKLHDTHHLIRDFMFLDAIMRR